MIQELSVSDILNNILASLIVLIGLFYLLRPRIKVSPRAVITIDGHLAFIVENSGLLDLNDIEISAAYTIKRSRVERLDKEIPLHQSRLFRLKGRFCPEEQRAFMVESRDVIDMSRFDSAFGLHIFVRSIHSLSNITYVTEKMYQYDDVFLGKITIKGVENFEGQELFLTETVCGIYEKCLLFLTIVYTLLAILVYKLAFNQDYVIIFGTFVYCLILLVWDTKLCNRICKMSDHNVWKSNRDEYVYKS